jgi:putative glutamine amidotransferase
MTPANPQPSATSRPRVGIPWRTSAEEEKAAHGGPRGKTEDYLKAVEKAGGEGLLIPLKDQETRNAMIPTLDAFVLPGSPADVAPSEYGAVDHGLSEPPDLAREETDRSILKFALEQKKPVLAICYGCQLLNVYDGGTLIQDLKAETGTAMPHRRKDVGPEAKDDPIHNATFESGSRIASIAGSNGTAVNSSHHQAIAKPGKNLCVTARASDGTVEAVEWTGDSNWVVGVQWHPERMPEDPLAQRLFREFVSAARAREVVAHKK